MLAGRHKRGDIPQLVDGRGWQPMHSSVVFSEPGKCGNSRPSPWCPCENPGWRAVAALYERRSALYSAPAVIDRRYKSGLSHGLPWGAGSAHRRFSQAALQDPPSEMLRTSGSTESMLTSRARSSSKKSARGAGEITWPTAQAVGQADLPPPRPLPRPPCGPEPSGGGPGGRGNTRGCGPLSPGLRRCEKIKTALAKVRRRKGAQSESGFFS